MQISPYLAFDGQCEAAFRFYAACLGGRIEMMMTHGESPMADRSPPEARDRIMHAQLVVGDTVLMASDGPPGHHQAMQGFSVSLMVGEPAEAERVFAALAEGGTVRMPLEETFWAMRFGMVTDRFGTPWMVNCERPAQAASV